MSKLFVAHAIVAGPVGPMQKLHDALLDFAVRNPKEDMNFEIVPTDKAHLAVIAYDAQAENKYPFMCAILNGKVLPRPGWDFSLDELKIYVAYGEDDIQAAMLKTEGIKAHGRAFEQLLAIFHTQCLSELELMLNLENDPPELRPGDVQGGQLRYLMRDSAVKQGLLEKLEGELAVAVTGFKAIAQIEEPGAVETAGYDLGAAKLMATQALQELETLKAKREATKLDPLQGK